MNATVPPEGLAGVYRTLVENAVDLMTIIDQDGRVIYQNPAITNNLGWQPAELVGRNIFDFVHADDATLAADAYARILQGDEQARITVRFKNKNGSHSLIEVVGRVLAGDGGERVVLTSRDVTEQRQMVARIERSEALFRAAFNSTSTLYALVDVDRGTIEDVNDAFVAQLGWGREDVLGKTATALGLWPVEDYESLLKTMRRDRLVDNRRTEIFDRAGQPRVMLISARLIESMLQEDAGLTREHSTGADSDRRLAYFSALDITEREAVEDQLRQAQRMEAVGQLTGGIAHDFNNLLTVIMGHVELGLRRGARQVDLQNTLSTIRAIVERASELVQKLMTFSRKQRLSPVTTRMQDVLADVRVLLEHSLGSAVRLEFDTSRTQWACHVDCPMLENAIVNMVLNARDAMPDGGVISITVSDVVLAGDALAPNGDFIEMLIADTGVGMTADTARRVFEPFFTTKESGHGTGLGLSMVYGFVKQSQGHISLQSIPGHGTTFRVLLPRYMGAGA